MQKPRRIIFFDRHVVKEGTDVHTGVQKLDIACACGSSDRLWFGERNGEVRSLNREFKLSQPLQTFPDGGTLIALTVAQDGKRLVALGCDAGGNTTTKYKVFDVQQEDSPPVSMASGRVLPPRAPELYTTCLAANSTLSLLAIGISSGAIYLWRGRDLSVDRPYATVIPDDGANSAVTAVHFLEQGHRTVLFAASATSIKSWSVQEREDACLRVLNTDSGEGSEPQCCCIFPTVNSLLVARSSCVFAYDPDEGNMSAMPLDGEKSILTSFKSYFAVVTTENNQGVLDPFTSATGGSPPAIPKQTVTVMLAYPHMKFIAYSALFTDVTHVVAGLGGLFVVSRGGADGSSVIFELREKPLTEQLDILVKKRMFEWAAEVALQGGAPAESTAEIYRMHGDSFFEKRAYDQALGVYIKTVNLGLPLEPSYVVEKYLEVQRIGHVAQYLRKLHEASLAEPEHTALLLKCYTKLKDASALDEFLEKTPVSQYDPSVAIEVLEAGGYYGLAAAIAQKEEVEHHEDWVRISIEHFRSYTKTVEYLAKLPGEKARDLVMKYGRVLMSHAPTETVELIRDLCGLKSTTEHPWRASLSSVSGSGVGKMLKGFLPCFVDDDEGLEAFLRSLLLGPGVCPLPAVDAERVVFPTLLELMLRSYSNAVKATEGGERCRLDGTPEDEDLRRRHAEIMQLIRQCQSEEDSLVTTLMLSQTFDFSAGFFHAAESLGRYQLLMHWCIQRKDTKRLIEVCKRSGNADQSLWMQALSYLASDAENHAEEITEILQYIEGSDLFPLLMVIETLQGCSGLTLATVRPYLQGQFKKTAKSVESSREKAQQDRQEVLRMQQEITNLRTQAQVFQGNKCHSCRIQLDVPAVYFFCGHSYHTYCVSGDGGCPQCTPEALPKMRMRARREAQSRNAEDFFRCLQGGGGDKQIQAITEWYKFGPVDAGKSSDPTEEGLTSEFSGLPNL